MDFTADELMSTCIAHQIDDGELVVQGLATPLVTAGYLLAKLTHAPNLLFASAIGQALCRDWAPMGLSGIESLWLDKALVSLGFTRSVAELLPIFHPKEFFRPAQIDPRGNFNNVVIGSDYSRPLMRLPGSGGIPDVTTYSSAGHNPPLLYRRPSNGEKPVTWLRPTGAAIGLVEDAAFGKAAVTLAPGNILLLYTDGVTEAMNKEGEEFGSGRLAAAVEQDANLPPQELVRRLRRRLQEFSGGRSLADDTTIVAYRSKK